METCRRATPRAGWGSQVDGSAEGGARGSVASDKRGQAAAKRDQAAVQGDQAGDERDRAAERRDEAADGRDRAAEKAEASADVLMLRLEAAVTRLGPRSVTSLPKT